LLLLLEPKMIRASYNRAGADREALGGKRKN